MANAQLDGTMAQGSSRPSMVGARTRVLTRCRKLPVMAGATISWNSCAACSFPAITYTRSASKTYSSCPAVDPPKRSARICTEPGRWTKTRCRALAAFSDVLSGRTCATFAWV